MVKLILVLFAALPAMAGSYRLCSDTLHLDVGSYRFIKFRITPDQAAGNIEITGRFATDPDDAPVELILLTEWNYLTGWVTRGDIDTLAIRTGGPGELSIPVPDYGDYVLILSNRGNRIPVRLCADFSVTFDGTGISYDSLPMGMTILVTLLALALVIAAVVLAVKKLG
jgi:hypothetical protein